MTAIAFVFGSIFGFIGAVIGLVFLDMSILSAVALYLGFALGCGLVAAARQLACDTEIGSSFSTAQS